MAKEYAGFYLDGILRGQAWEKRERSHLGRHIVRVMVVSDEWVMVRQKGCQPFTIFWKDLIAWYHRVPDHDTNSARHKKGVHDG